MRTAQPMAAEKINRSRMELPLCIGLSASEPSSDLQRRASRFKIPCMHSGCLALGRRRTRRNKRRKPLRPRADGVLGLDELRLRARCPMERPNRFASCCAVLRSCDDQIQIEPLDPSLRASELISGEPKALFGILRSRFPPLARAPHLRRSKNRRFGSNSAGSTNGAYGRNVRL